MATTLVSQREVHMRIFYFGRDIERKERGYTIDYGNFQDEYFTNPTELIRYANNELTSKLTKKEINSIIFKDLPDFDCYAVQKFVDGYGNDTQTVTIFRTYEEAKTFVRDNEESDESDLAIVGQWYGQEYNNKW